MDTLKNSQQEIFKLLSEPYYHKADFYINVLLAIVGIAISLLAVKAAKNATSAALEAKRTIQLQSIIIEFTELTLKLDVLDESIQFNQARLYIIEINRRIKRQTSLLVNYEYLTSNIIEIDRILTTLQDSLDNTRPIAQIEVINNSIFHAIEADLRRLSGELASIIGSLESETVNIT